MQLTHHAQSSAAACRDVYLPFMTWGLPTNFLMVSSCAVLTYTVISLCLLSVPLLHFIETDSFTVSRHEVLTMKVCAFQRRYHCCRVSLALLGSSA
jgi:hypothetical protein